MKCHARRYQYAVQFASHVASNIKQILSSDNLRRGCSAVIFEAMLSALGVFACACVLGQHCCRNSTQQIQVFNPDSLAVSHMHAELGHTGLQVAA